MKKHFIVCFVFLLAVSNLFAQPPGKDERIPERMSFFIGRRMHLNEKDMEQFKAVFNRYHQEWRASLKKYKDDRLLMQQQVIELQLRYRKEFAPIVGEKEVVRIYDLQQEFIHILRDIQRERMHLGGPPPPPEDRPEMGRPRPRGREEE